MYNLLAFSKQSSLKIFIAVSVLVFLFALVIPSTAHAHTTGTFGPGECNDIDHEHYFDADSGTCLDGRAPVGGGGGSASDSVDPALDPGTGGRPVLGIIPVPAGFPTEPNAIIASAVNVLFALAGLVFFAMLLIGGLRYLTAGGDEKAVMAARQSLTNAFIGLVIVVAAFLVAQILFSVFGFGLLVNVI
jgi:hypothetical protein